MTDAYYNENDPKAAAWLRELIRQGHIAPGDVDERSIEDVTPDDLKRYTQCHFFAGIGVWSYALRRAGWPDDRPIWTGSCPCQPFSSAGKGDGFDDERHLRPAWYWLVSECRPAKIVGEQVASKNAEPWIDLVQADLEALGYAFGCVPFPSAGVGAPHIRDRAYWGAERLDDAPSTRHDRTLQKPEEYPRDEARLRMLSTGRGHSGLADDDDDNRRAEARHGLPASGHDGLVGDRTTGGFADRIGSGQQGPRRGGEEQEQRATKRGVLGGLGLAVGEPRQRVSGSVFGEETQVDGTRLAVDGREPVRPEHAGPSMGGLADATSEQRDEGRVEAKGDKPEPVIGFARHGAAFEQANEQSNVAVTGGIGGSGPINGLWRNADWLFCRDGKWRPVEPGAFPLAHGAAERVGLLRGYGNAINAEAAAIFIEAFAGFETVEQTPEGRGFRLTNESVLTHDNGVFD